jgi:hypothetical protein
MIDVPDITQQFEHDDADVAEMLHEIDVSIRQKIKADSKGGPGGAYPDEAHVPGFDRVSADLDEMARRRGDW